MASHWKNWFAIIGSSGVLTAALISTRPWVEAQEPTKAAAKAPPEKEFADYLTNSVLTGVFTIDGEKLDKLEPESYEIRSAKKLEGYDSLWEVTARIKYGKRDIEVPVEINVEWAGKTPVMLMDSAAIPGLGTFSARVVFHDKKYAGTWKHDDKGGHLFGRVEKIADK
jgi:hypothetical protein